MAEKRNKVIGRPKSPKVALRIHRVSILFTRAEYAQMRRAAGEVGVMHYLRRMVLERVISPFR